jgi:hypothetical protein
MAILVKNGRIVLAESIAARPIHLAWGEGDGQWLNNVPPEDVNATALQGEVARRLATQVGYVLPDVTGNIELPNGNRYRLSQTSTNHLYARTQFDYTDGVGAAIRNIAIFVGTEVVGGLPPGQQYFTPAQVSNPGRMLHLEHFPPIFRGSNERESFEVVITF